MLLSMMVAAYNLSLWLSAGSMLRTSLPAHTSSKISYHRLGSHAMASQLAALTWLQRSQMQYQIVLHTWTSMDAPS